MWDDDIFNSCRFADFATETQKALKILLNSNTNITFEKEMISGLVTPLGLGIIVGLFAGKTLRVTHFSWLAVKLKWADLPTGAGWKHVLGLGMLAGIGFTISIFIACFPLAIPYMF